MFWGILCWMEESAWKSFTSNMTQPLVPSDIHLKIYKRSKDCPEVIWLESLETLPVSYFLALDLMVENRYLQRRCGELLVLCI